MPRLRCARSGALLAVWALVGLGCAVRFDFGAAPIAYPTSVPAEGCAWAERIETRVASADWSLDRHVDRDSGLPTTAYFLRGLTFYKGDRRLTAEALLTELGDPHLAKAYAERYERPAGKRRLWRRRSAVALAVGLAAVAGGAVATALGAGELGPAPGGGPSAVLASTGGILTALGAATAGLGIGFWVRAHKWHQLEVAYRTIFVAPSLKPYLERATFAHNRRVERGCGLRRDEGSD